MLLSNFGFIRGEYRKLRDPLEDFGIPSGFLKAPKGLRCVDRCPKVKYWGHQSLNGTRDKILLDPRGVSGSGEPGWVMNFRVGPPENPLNTLCIRPWKYCHFLFYFTWLQEKELRIECSHFNNIIALISCLDFNLFVWLEIEVVPDELFQSILEPCQIMHHQDLVSVLTDALVPE